MYLNTSFPCNLDSVMGKLMASMGRGGGLYAGVWLGNLRESTSWMP